MASLNLSMGTSAFSGTEQIKKALELVKAAGIKEIDTAQMYGGGQNEVDLGNAGVIEMGFSVSTKNLGGWAGGRGQALLPDNLVKSTHVSLEKLKTKQVDIFYIHGPDRTMKLEQWVPTINDLYEQGAFLRFGVSNFAAEEVRALYDYCKANGYVLPTVFQGNYNAVARTIETTLFPLLRELGIVFYAYSPMAGGFLARSVESLEEGSRFKDAGAGIQQMYRGMYMKPTKLKALEKWGAIAEQEGCSRPEMAYRWVYYHSALKPEKGDFLIMGASKLEQITSSADGLKKGPLKPESAKAIDAIWDLVKNEAALDNFDNTQT
jgi:aflatoxin B1 aldehyde reductase